MPLITGTRLGPYEIGTRIGVGGMGEVYRATDTNLKRPVAIKVLPASLAEDADRLARFQREAEVLATLNHPNIATIHGLERSGGLTGLVMELVEGPTLAERIARGALSLDESLPIARQIAEALEAAHERGIIHRDLKPANIKVRADGTVKVLDFGLAKTMEPIGIMSPSTSQAATMAIPAATQAGMILGTPAYMSPEQAKGTSVDKRSDIWAFGCVLFEMVSGKPPFTGDTATDIIAAILEREPIWSQVPSHATRRLDWILRRCLEKDPRQRLHDIADVRIELAHARVSDPQKLHAPLWKSRGVAAWVGIAALIAAAAGVAGGWMLAPRPAALEMWLQIAPSPARQVGLAVSPDGNRIVFAAGPTLWLRSLASPAVRPLEGTEGGSDAFWSPDGKSIGFFADGRLKRMEVDGGSLRTLRTVTGASGGGAWNTDGTIVYAPAPGVPLLRISADGSGEPEPVTRFQSPQHRSHGFPMFLPDGRHFLFFVIGQPESRGVYLGTLGSLDSTRLFDAQTPAVYVSTGHLLFGREGRLWAQPFDAERLTTRGDPFAIATGIAERTVLSTSNVGTIAFRTPAPESGQRLLTRVDRSGRELEQVSYQDTASLGPAMTRDGAHVAVFRFTNGNMDIWSYDVARRIWSRETFDSADEIFPVFSPDASRLAFGSNRRVNQGAVQQNLFVKHLGSAPGSEQLLLATPEIKLPMDWSPDGRILLFDTVHPTSGQDIVAMPLDGGAPVAVVQTEFNERLAQFSPDGKWIAYQSDQTGHFEIYVQPFPGPGPAIPVSPGGGEQARWNPAGGELFYIAPDDRLMSVAMQTAPGGTATTAGTPTALFVTNVGSNAPNKARQQYVVASDGRSFVMNSVPPTAAASPITVILNFNGMPR